MTLYRGETIRIRAEATDPETHFPLEPPPTEAFVDFWAPRRDPRTDPTLISSPDVAAQPMTYRAQQQDFVLYQHTDQPPWTSGEWIFRVTMVGSTSRNWEYDSFRLYP